MKRTALLTTGIVLAALGPLSFFSGVAYVLTLQRTYTCSALVRLYVRGEPDALPTEAALTTLARTEAAIMVANPVLDATTETLGLREQWGAIYSGEGVVLSADVARRSLQRSVSAEVRRDAPGLVDVRAERRDAEEAARIVNTLIREYQQHVESKSNEFPVHGVEVISEADPSDHHLSPDLFRHMTFHAVIAAILMLLGGVLIVKAGRRKGNVQQGPPPIPGTPRERLDGEG